MEVKNNEEAIKTYTQCLHIEPLNKKFNAIIYANRALAYIKL